jgi:prefoldin subunit 5
MIPLMVVLEMANTAITVEHLSSLLSEVKSAIAAGTSEVKSIVSSVHSKLDTEVASIHSKLETVNTSINSSLPGGLGQNTTLAGIEGKIDDVITKVINFADKVAASANNVVNPASASAASTPAPTVPPTPVANMAFTGITAALPSIAENTTSTGVGVQGPQPLEPLRAQGPQAQETAPDLGSMLKDQAITALTSTVNTLQTQLNALQTQMAEILALKGQMETLSKKNADEQPTKDLNEERLKAVEILAQRVPDIQKTITQHAKKLNTVTLHQAGLQNFFTSITPLNSEANTVESSPEASPPSPNLSITLTPINAAPPVQIISPP